MYAAYKLSGFCSALISYVTLNLLLGETEEMNGSTSNGYKTQQMNCTCFFSNFPWIPSLKLNSPKI